MTTGRVLANRYVLEQMIGKGGMAYVYRALDQNTQKTVAVKVLREEFRDDQDFIARFEREAIAASRMTHPNIVNLLDVGVEDEIRYIVIEYVSGKTLKEFIRETGGLRNETSAQIAMRVLAALQHAHQNGIIHRDIKPQNILINQEGVVKVTDFGIARMVSVKTELQNEESNVGSVYYFSPEQAKGEPADEKSDIYSVGVVLYEMLTGNVPFQGDTPVSVALQHIQDQPIPPAQVKPGVSQALSDIAMKAMSKKPEDRFESASIMIQELKHALRRPSSPPLPKPATDPKGEKRLQAVRRRMHWMRTLMASVFSLLLLTVIVLLLMMAGRSLFRNMRNRVVLPDVTNMSLEDARHLLADEKGLTVEVNYQVFLLVPENIVADQMPVSGTTLARGDMVSLTVSRSEYDLVMPSVVDLRLSDALKVLDEYGIKVGSQTLEVSDAGELRIIGQEPAAGTLGNRGDKISLRVSGGNVIVPKVVGLSETDAIQSLAAAKLVWAGNTEQRTSDAEKADKVIAQTPAPYEKVLPGTPIEFTVARLDPRIYLAQIELTIQSDVDQVVSVALVRQDGTEEMQYCALHAAGSQCVVSLVLCSEVAGEQSYRVYYQDRSVTENKVTFQ